MKKAKIRSTCQGKPNGFTLVELFIVLSVVAIVAAAMFLRATTISTQAVFTTADQLRQDIAHMQMLAMTWGVPLRLTLDPDGKKYTVKCRAVTASLPAGTGCPSVDAIPIDPATGTGFVVPNPIDAADPATVPVTIYVPALSNGKVIRQFGTVLDFDSMGRPVNNSVLISTNTSIPVDSQLPANPAARLVITNTDDSKSATVSVHPITGYTEVN